MVIATSAGSFFTWGFYAKDVITELNLTAADIGAVSGFAIITYSVFAPVTGVLLSRFGCRRIMMIGCLVASCGCGIVATSQGFWQFVFGFGVLVAAGAVLHITLPSQTLLIHWFDQYRARALALFSTSVSVGGFVWLQLHNEIVQSFDWRMGWWLAAAIQLGLSALIPLIIKNRPEDLNLQPDDTRKPFEANTGNIKTSKVQKIAIKAAVQSPQFIFLVFLSIAAVAPNSLVVVHGRLHLEGLGLTQAAAVGVLSIASLIGIVGRLSSGLADFVSPNNILFCALTLEALGCFGLIFSELQSVAYLSVVAIGMGFGASFQIVTVLMGRYFGRDLFSSIQGLRIAAAGIFNAIIPWAVGLSADLTGSYSLALALEGVTLCLLIVIAVRLMRSPIEPYNLQ